MTLHEGSRPLRVPAERTLISYVLRHSSSGMNVRSSLGHQCRLQPGAMLVCTGPGLELQRGPANRHGGCEAIDLLLPGMRNPGAFVHMDDYYPTFVNRPQGCIRLLMGGWERHRAMLDPLEGFWMLDVDVVPAGELSIPAAGPGVLGLLTSGTLLVEGRTVSGPTPLLFDTHADAVRLVSESGASLLLYPQGFL
jgi:hypothetical protein